MEIFKNKEKPSRLVDIVVSADKTNESTQKYNQIRQSWQRAEQSMKHEDKGDISI